MKKFHSKTLSSIPVIILAITLVIFLQCESNQNFQPEDEPFVNPFEFVGEVHNNGLEFIIKNLKTISVEEGAAQLVELTSNFVNNNKENEFVFNETINYNNFGKAILNELEIQTLSKNDVTPFINDHISQHYLERLQNVIINELSINNSEYVFFQISKLERDIQFSDLSDEDKYLLLSICSVGKYSFTFWTEYLLDSQYEMKGLLPESVKIRLINADIEGSITGAIAGGIIGGVYGSVLLPGVGTVTAAIVEGVHGGIYGAVIGSGFSYIKYLINKPE